MPGWGAKPFENDAALAWIDSVGRESWDEAELEKSINEVTASWKAWKAKTKRKNSLGLQEERRAAAQLIIDESRKGLVFSNRVINETTDSLLQLGKDGKWLEQWDHPSDNTVCRKDIFKDILRQLEELGSITEKNQTALEESRVHEIISEAEAALRARSWDKVTF